MYTININLTNKSFNSSLFSIHFTTVPRGSRSLSPVPFPLSFETRHFSTHSPNLVQKGPNLTKHKIKYPK